MTVKRLVVAAAAAFILGTTVLTAGITATSTPQPAPMPIHPFGVSTATSPSPTHAPAPVLGPNQLSIPSLHVSAPLVPETVSHHSLNIPPIVKHVGIWSGGGTITGTTGTVLLAGHINWYNQGNGALYDLAQITPGAAVYVSGPTGTVTSWVAVGLSSMLHAALPQTIFAPTGPRRLVIVTCGGPFTASRHTYIDNIVVRAVPAR